MTVCYTDMNNNGSPYDVGDSVDVCVNKTYNPFMIQPVFSGLFGGGTLQIPLKVTGSARLEQQPTPSMDPGCPCPVATPAP